MRECETVLEQPGEIASVTNSHPRFNPQKKSTKPMRWWLRGLLATALVGTSAALPCMQVTAQPPLRNSGRTQQPPPRQTLPNRFAPPTPEPPIGKDGKLTAGPSKGAAKPGSASPIDPAVQPGQVPPKPSVIATEDEKNQRIAPDWKKPWVVFFITGKQNGYMEPCGCTGLENQKGGLNRRETLLQSLRQRGWDVLPIDAGGQVSRFGKQSEIKYQWTARALGEMNYAATTFGEDDLKLSVDPLMLSMLDVDAHSNQLFVSANVSIMPGEDIPYKILKVNDKKIGITAVLGDKNVSNVLNADIQIKPAVPALKQIATKLRAEKCDYLILIAHASLEESRAIAKEVPIFQLIVTSGGYGEPTYRPEQVPGTGSLMVQVGAKGMYAGLFGLFDDPKQPIQYQRVALSSQFADSAHMMDLFGKYQDELKVNTFEGLGLRPAAHPTGREFVGSETCGECHATAFDIWKNTPHFHATDSIVEPPQRSMARHFDPECLSCHVTGWNPQGFFPYQSGYESLDSTPLMVGNGCENCHGPGSKHVAAEQADNMSKELLEPLRHEMRLPLAKAESKCQECHDSDNSPEFHNAGAFDAYWERIKHYGKD